MNLKEIYRKIKERFSSHSRISHTKISEEELSKITGGYNNIQLRSFCAVCGCLPDVYGVKFIAIDDENKIIFPTNVDFCKKHAEEWNEKIKSGQKITGFDFPFLVDFMKKNIQ